jgi:hypothetical protein
VTDVRRFNEAIDEAMTEAAMSRFATPNDAPEWQPSS